MRIFFALIPPAGFLETLRPIMCGVDGARWQTAEQLHITLRFVGEVAPALVEELALALPRLAVAVPPLTLSGSGAFPTHGRPNALWVGVRPVEPLARLHGKLDRLCQQYGLEPDRRAYLPHLTVARLPKSARGADHWVGQNGGFTAGPIAFTRCALMESHLGASGSQYQELAGFSIL
jgi:2'-5' RNA ligase